MAHIRPPRGGLTFMKVIFIPCRLIWSVKIRWTQKVALISTLCLTVLTIMCTIVRIAGIHTGRTVKSIDSVWETYWQFIAANIALTMTAVTAFRTFFVSRGAEDRRHPDPGSKENWYSKGRRLLRSVFSTRLWYSRRSKSSSRTPGGPPSSWDDAPMELKQDIPRATLTGMRTFINGRKLTPRDRESQIMRSVGEEEYQDDWPLSAIDEDPKYSSRKTSGIRSDSV